MEIITKEAEASNKNSQNFRTKIDELNQKLNSIKQNFIRKKSTNEKIKKIKSLVQNRQIEKIKDGNACEFEQVIFEKDRLEFDVMKNIVKEQECNESDDTYYQEMGSQYRMPSFKPQNGMRKTALPPHLVQEEKNMEKTSEWHHESAGNLQFKKFIQKSREAYPQLFDLKDNKSLSKVSSAKKIEINPKSLPKTKLKKMMSM